MVSPLFRVDVTNKKYLLLLFYLVKTWLSRQAKLHK